MTVMKYFHHTIRILTGLLFVAIFASKFGFLPSAVNNELMFTPDGWEFIKAIQANGYMFLTIGIISLVSGLALLANRYVALAAMLMIPITVNFALFHIFLGFPIDSIFHFFREIVGFVPLALSAYILYSERRKFILLLKS